MKVMFLKRRHRMYKDVSSSCLKGSNFFIHGITLKFNEEDLIQWFGSKRSTLILQIFSSLLALLQLLLEKHCSSWKCWGLMPLLAERHRHGVRGWLWISLDRSPLAVWAVFRTHCISVGLFIYRKSGTEGWPCCHARKISSVHRAFPQ